MVKLNIDDLP
jgi:thioredoxin-like negative regulator of GroEL